MQVYLLVNADGPRNAA